MIGRTARDQAQIDGPGERRRPGARRRDHGDATEGGLRRQVHDHRLVAARRAGRDAPDPTGGHERRGAREASGDRRDRHRVRAGVVGHLQVGQAGGRRQREHDLFFVVLTDDEPVGPGVVVGVGADVGGRAGKAPLVERGRAEHGAADSGAAGHERLRPRRAAVVLQHAQIELPARDRRRPGEGALGHEVIGGRAVRVRPE